MKNHSTILVTGFGPFLHHTTNPSNLAVAHLTSTLTAPAGARLVTLPKLEVAYAAVRDALPLAWAEHRPAFTLHVGVGLAGKFRLERFARNTGYWSHDVRGEYVGPTVASMPALMRPANRAAAKLMPELNQKARAVAEDDALDVYETKLDLPRMVAALSSVTGKEVEVSEDAGQYLCDFTYTSSMYLSGKHDGGDHDGHKCQGRALFLHVPPVGEPYTQDEINDFVVKAVEY
ncbi:hypothetical protein BCR44DRAFT_1435069, partial [Catenaria anguillulae PL171]